jgi:precorrin-6Y C5,15-methyltransferase (decarboxylating)
MRLEPSDWQPPTVVLIGMGMGGEDLTPAALRWIEQAEVLAGGKRHLEGFPGHTGGKIVIDSNLNNFFSRVETSAKERRTAVLASGDPFFFGIGRRLRDRLGRENLFAIPNVTSVQYLFARLMESWDDVKVLTLHGRRGEAGGWMRELRNCSRLAILTDPKHTPGWIAREMLSREIHDWHLVVGEDLGLSSERLRHLSPREAAEENFSPLNVVALFQKEEKDNVEAMNLPALGLEDEKFQHHAGLITKMEIRAVVLSQLQLRAGLVLWDLGAGSGSVSIEASRMVPMARVFAVEKDEHRYQDILENIRRFKCYEMQALHGRAAEIIDRLEDPDRVFIGGSGGDLEVIIAKATSRLRPGGSIVLTAVTIETLEKARSLLKSAGFDVSFLQVMVNRSVGIGKSERLEALNPVFIITARPRPA